jgi:hypothetical protein
MGSPGLVNLLGFPALKIIILIIGLQPFILAQFVQFPKGSVG